MEFFNNPWFIGIGGGILSGLIVTFISRNLLSRRDQREYAEKLRGANREIIYAVRPGISEGLIPTSDVLDSLIEATARKFSVDSEHLFRPQEIAQELVKEVMDSSFISAKTKEDYCSQLSALVKPKTITDIEKPVEKSALRRTPEVEEYRSRMVAMVSMTLGLITMIMTIIFALTNFGPMSDSVIDVKDSLLTVSLPALAVSFGGGISVMMMWLLREVHKRGERREMETDQKSFSQGDSSKRKAITPSSGA